MQSTSKQTHYFFFSITGILILVQIILLVLAESYWQTLILAAITILAFFTIFNIVFFYIQADVSFFRSSFFAAQIFQPIFNRRSTLFTIKNGKVDRDYFLLSTKPRTAGIYIHSDSAAIVANSRGDLKPMRCGFHVLRSGERISTSFDLGMITINCGPENGENPFAKRKSGENFTSFHARQLRAQAVRSVTADHQEIYPAFVIRYCLRPHDGLENQSIVNIASFLIENNLSGPAVPALNTYLSKIINSYWAARIQQAPLTALLSGVDGNSFYNILLDINTQLNSTPPAGKQAAALRTMDKGLSEIKHLKIPFIRLYLAKVWYLDAAHSAAEEFERAA